MIKKLVSIVIPTYNEEDVIEKLLQSIKAQTYPEIETLIIDDDSSDNTVKIAKKYSKVYEQSHKERRIQGRILLFFRRRYEIDEEYCKEVC